MAESTNVSSHEVILTLKNPVFCAYLISSCILVVKMMLMSLLTCHRRIVNKACISIEDAEFSNGDVIVNDSVERIRRAHQNDLENIPIFWASAFAYLWVRPSAIVSFLLFFGFTVVRIFHTIVYALIVAPQPSRAIMFFTGFFITAYMAVHSIVAVFMYTSFK